MTEPFRLPDLEFPPDVKDVLGNSDRHDVRLLGAFLEDLMEELRSSLDLLDKSSRDPSRLSINGSPLTQQIATIERKIITIKRELLDSLPTTGVRLLGPYTDDFRTAHGLTGPYQDGITGVAASANGYLTLSGLDSGNGYAYMGSNRGTFLPRNGNWTVTIKITECGQAVVEQAGFGLYPTAFADGMNWGAAGHTNMRFWYQTGTPLYRIYTVDQTGQNTEDVAALPTRADPLYLRCSQTFPADVRTLTWQRKYESDGSWTTIATTTPDGTWLSGDLDVGPLMRAVGGTASVEFDSLTVDYDPNNLENIYAFIPTQAFGGYKKNHVYIKQKDGKYYDVDPSDRINKDTPFLVWDRDLAVHRVWDGTNWSVVKLLLHVPSHEHGGDDELLVERAGTASTDVSTAARPDGSGGIEFRDVNHTELVGVATDQHQARLHDMDNPLDHTSPAGTEDNFASFNAAGYPVRDSGKNALSFVPTRSPVYYGAEALALILSGVG